MPAPPAPTWRIILAPIVSAALLVILSVILGYSSTYWGRAVGAAEPFIGFGGIGIVLVVSSYLGGRIAARWIVPVVNALLIMGAMILVIIQTSKSDTVELYVVPVTLIYMGLPFAGFYPAWRRAKQKQQQALLFDLELGAQREEELRML